MLFFYFTMKKTCLFLYNSVVVVAFRDNRAVLTTYVISINFLRHAGIFTAEEVIYIAREKLIKLQSLYIDQFRRLQYILKEKRRKYLLALKKEKETLCKHISYRNSNNNIYYLMFILICSLNEISIINKIRKVPLTKYNLIIWW